MILAISYPGEDHTDAVVGALERDGHAVLRLDFADIPARAAPSAEWRDGAPPRFEIVGGDGRVHALHDARAVWWRRVQPFGIDPAIGGVDRRHFANSETTQAVHGILDSLRCPWVNPRGADAAAHHKPYQWSVAQDVGLALPRTLATADPAAARRFVDDLGVGRVVFKPFLASIEDWRETRLVEADDVRRLELVRLAPVIFQEYVEGVDLRITIVGDEIFAAEIDARRTRYPVDMRMVIDEGTVRPVELPAALRRRLLALQRRLGLVYGAVDMRRTDGGDYRFLEVNPAGQWLFVEQRTGQPITRAHAGLLARLAARGDAPPTRPGHRRPPPVRAAAPTSGG